MKREGSHATNSFNLLYCGSIAGKPAICGGYKLKEELLSVGIDLGTSTTQLIFSKLIVENIDRKSVV